MCLRGSGQVGWAKRKTLRAKNFCPLVTCRFDLRQTLITGSLSLDCLPQIGH